MIVAEVTFDRKYKIKKESIRASQAAIYLHIPKRGSWKRNVGRFLTQCRIEVEDMLIVERFLVLDNYQLKFCPYTIDPTGQTWEPQTTLKGNCMVTRSESD